MEIPSSLPPSLPPSSLRRFRFTLKFCFPFLPPLLFPKLRPPLVLRVFPFAPSLIVLWRFQLPCFCIPPRPSDLFRAFEKCGFASRCVRGGEKEGNKEDRRASGDCLVASSVISVSIGFCLNKTSDISSFGSKEGYNFSGRAK